MANIGKGISKYRLWCYFNGGVKHYYDSTRFDDNKKQALEKLYERFIQKKCIGTFRIGKIINLDTNKPVHLYINGTLMPDCKSYGNDRSLSKLWICDKDGQKHNFYSNIFEDTKSRQAGIQQLIENILHNKFWFSHKIAIIYDIQTNKEVYKFFEQKQL